MFLKLIKFAAIACVVPLLLAFSLIASQQSQDRTGESSLDFSRLPEIGGQSSPLIGYTTFDGDELGFRRFETTEDGAPLLVLVHGSGWHGLAYVQLAQRIAEAGLADVVVPDLRGHGPSPQRRGDVDYIGQLENDLHALIKQEVSEGQSIVMAGHSSGGGLVIRYANGEFGDDLGGAILMAPFLKHDAPTMRPSSGGWAEAKVRRIIGLSMLNTVGIKALNHLPIIDFAFSQDVIDGPLGQTATRAYSYRMNVSFAPRSDYLQDVAKLPPFLLVAGRDDEAFVSDLYEPTLSSANPGGRYVLIDGVSHLDLISSDMNFNAIRDYLAGFDS